MGLLALAGAVSGAGQAAERGLINLQTGLIQSGLAEERDARLAKRETARDMADRDFQMRKQREAQTFEQQLRTTLMENEQTFKAGESAKDRTFRETEGERDRQNRLDVNQDSNLSAAARETAQLEAKATEHDKTLAHDTAKQQGEIAKDIVLQSMKLQEARESLSIKGDVKLNPRVKAQIDFQMEKLKGLEDRMKGGILPAKELAAAQREVDQIGATIDRLVGMTPSATKPAIIDPDAPSDDMSDADAAKAAREGESVTKAQLEKEAPKKRGLIHRSYDERVEGRLKDAPFDRFERWRKTPKPKSQPYDSVTRPNLQ